MNIKEAEQLAKLGKKMLDPEVWEEVQRLTNPNIKFGPKIMGGVVPPSEHSIVQDRDGHFDVSSPKPGTVYQPPVVKAKKEK